MGTPELEVTSRYSRDWNWPVAGHLQSSTEGGLVASWTGAEHCSAALVRLELAGSVATMVLGEGGRQLCILPYGRICFAHTPAVPSQAHTRPLVLAQESATHRHSPVHALHDLGAHQGAAGHNALQVDQLGQELQRKRVGSTDRK